MSTWHYYNEYGEKIGPVTGGQLYGLAKRGRIHSGTVIETEEGKILPARKVKGLKFVDAPQPSAAPVAANSNPADLPPPPIPTPFMPTGGQTMPQSVSVAGAEESKTSFMVAMIGIVLILAVGGTLIFWIITSPSSSPKAARETLPFVKAEVQTTWSVAFSANGMKIVAVNHDGTARILDAKSRQVLQTFGGDSERVQAAAFSPDGTKLVTINQDTTVRVWDVESGEELRELEENPVTESDEEITRVEDEP